MNLISSFGESLFGDFSELIKPILDTGLDAILDNPAIKAVPIVKNISFAKDIIVCIRDRHFYKKSLKFFSELEKEKVKPEEIEKRKRALEKNEKWIFDELEFLILTIERTDREEKTKIISQLYQDYLNGEIKKEEFDEYCTITERIFLGDIIQLREEWDDILKKNITIIPPLSKSDKDFVTVTAKVIRKYSFEHSQGRLLSLGLLIITSQKVHSDPNRLKYSLSYKGKKYCKILEKLNFLDMKYELHNE